MACAKRRALFALQEMAEWETEKMVRQHARLAVGASRHLRRQFAI
jgi:hypothetical protein